MLPKSKLITALTSLTSMPRAATSVAIMTGRRPERKSASTASRSRWSLSPWMTPQPTWRMSSWPSWSHIRLVDVKMSVREPISSERKICISTCCFCCMRST